MSLLALLLAAVVGVAVGIVAGLLGIGGGILMVPLLYLLMGGAGWSGLTVLPEHEAALAHATSLFVIIFAALSGLRTFHREGAVGWPVVLPLGIFAALAAVLGAGIAAALPSALLKALFGVFLLGSGARLVRKRRRSRKAAGVPVPGPSSGPVPPSPAGPESAPPPDREAPLRWWGAVVGGAAIGFLSALLGVGGGIVAIPILITFAGMGPHRVVPASIGIICFAAPAGVLGYVLGGWGAPGLPPGSLGFVHLPTALAMLPGAVLLAPVGARLNRRLPVRSLEGLFAVLMLALGLWLVASNGHALLGGG
jgi:uncharacterized protein